VSLNGYPQPFYLMEKFRRKVKLKIEKLKKSDFEGKNSK
jgi:hypothetical protein